MRENRRVEATVSGPESGDAFGQALLDLTAGSAGSVVIERDDGWVSAEGLDYLEAPDGPDLWAVDRAVGRVLDIGAGAGRASLLLQDRGQEVLALDTSPGAVRACQAARCAGGLLRLGTASGRGRNDGQLRLSVADRQQSLADRLIRSGNPVPVSDRGPAAPRRSGRGDVPRPVRYHQAGPSGLPRAEPPPGSASRPDVIPGPLRTAGERLVRLAADVAGRTRRDRRTRRLAISPRSTHPAPATQPSSTDSDGCRLSPADEDHLRPNSARLIAPPPRSAFYFT